MSFADIRRHTLHNHTLNPDHFGEDATFTSQRPRADVPVRVKVTMRQTGNTTSATNAGNRPSNNQDEKEKIEVVFSRDGSWEFGGLTRKPEYGDKFQRSEARDPDRRAYQFAGEIVFEGDVHAVYVFERERSYVKGTGR